MVEVLNLKVLPSLEALEVIMPYYNDSSCFQLRISIEHVVYIDE